MTRDDGTQQLGLQGQAALHLVWKDTKPGDTTGDGLLNTNGMSRIPDQSPLGAIWRRRRADPPRGRGHIVKYRYGDGSHAVAGG